MLPSLGSSQLLRALWGQLHLRALVAWFRSSQGRASVGAVFSARVGCRQVLGGHAQLPAERLHALSQRAKLQLHHFHPLRPYLLRRPVLGALAWAPAQQDAYLHTTATTQSTPHSLKSPAVRTVRQTLSGRSALGALAGSMHDADLGARQSQKEPSLELQAGEECADLQGDDKEQGCSTQNRLQRQRASQKGQEAVGCGGRLF